MRSVDLLQTVGSGLLRLRWRLFLTLSGVLIGTCSMVLLMALGAGVQRALAAGFSQAGFATRITVRSEDAGMAAFSLPAVKSDSSPTARKLDARATLEIQGLPGVDGAFGRVSVPVTGIEFDEYQALVSIQGVDIRDFRRTADVAKGRLPGSQREIVVGANVPESFLGRNQLGETVPALELQNQTVKLRFLGTQTEGTGNDMGNTEKIARFRVTGVLAPTDPETDMSAFIPIDVAQSVFPDTNNREYDDIVVNAASTSVVDSTVKEIEAKGFEVSSMAESVNTLNDAMAFVQVALACLGGVALIVSALGIANTMTTSVLERTKEIGIMMAIGATRRAVLGLFLVESAVIGLLGGTSGLVVSAGIVAAANGLIIKATDATPGTPIASGLFYIPIWLALFAVVFAGAIGLGAGALPAIRASRLSPLGAIRQE